MSLIYTTQRALRQPAGIVFLHPSERVSRSELDRRDRCYRAKREAEYARAWAEDATLVGTIIYTTESNTRNPSDRSSVRRRRRNNNSVARRLTCSLKLKKLKNLFRHAQPAAS
ncbi:uncharacterized protein UMAG_04566 [Mycosarcoma maydis]|uniref:Uncharacterized protein n=1 Tax=Mycosarcoma maydis TaxID=5270 RepID=A0A0D1CL36_MYCMD|nr:uncharacterized protein UMAG_04566 [Ustilago maydis 521]KIS67468.1 hypothetical protein UMAG_04566 [Ustilago maydis 521]|eukprot:XP_011390880.1 hypothetical protein UMAG_04566 [Ustilago maydis 521]